MENITDSELLKIAENWEKEQPINIGIKTAFAVGYRMAEIKAKNCTIPDISDTVCDDTNPYLLSGNELRNMEDHKKRYGW